MIANTTFLFVAKNIGEGKVVTHSGGMQVVLVHLKHQGSHYVIIFDHNSRGMYLNRLKQTIVIDLYCSDNFESIEDDEEWHSVMGIIKAGGVEI